MLVDVDCLYLVPIMYVVLFLFYVYDDICSLFPGEELFRRFMRLSNVDC